MYSFRLDGPFQDLVDTQPHPSSILIVRTIKEFHLMAKLTIGFGVLLILLGITGYVTTGSAHPTALIPAGIGIFFILFGVMANNEDSKKRMLCG